MSMLPSLQEKRPLQDTACSSPRNFTSGKMQAPRPLHRKSPDSPSEAALVRELQESDPSQLTLRKLPRSSVNSQLDGPLQHMSRSHWPPGGAGSNSVLKHAPSEYKRRSP